MDLNDIRVEMGKIGVVKKINDVIAKKMLELCLVYNKSAEEFTETWIAFISRNGSQEDPTLELLNQMEREDFNRKSLQTSKKGKSRSQQTPMVVDSTPPNKALKTSCPELDSQNISPLGIRQSSPGFRLRSKQGEIVTSFGSKVSDWISDSSKSAVECQLHSSCTMKEPYPYMSTKLRDRCIILSELIDDISEQIAVKNEVDEWDAINVPKIDKVNVVGRICGDADGKLNASSLYLEGSRSTSSGLTVSLDVSFLSNYSFFPGQIIAGQGVNSSGEKLSLKSLYVEGTQLPFSDLNIDFGSDPLDIVVASGPFTPSDSNAYEPLEDLVKYICKHKPDVCILIGPFMESQQKILEEFDDICFNKFFEDQLNNISELTKEIKTQFILVSSQKDLNCHSIYPTPPLSLNKRNKDLQKRFLCVPDPAILEIGGVVVGVTSTDILFHLVKEEISFPPQEDRLGRLSAHLLSQHSFYPLYPPTSEDMCLDHEGYRMHALFPLTPHILILPSDLKCFIKDINGCVCINPEHLTRFTGGGCFARMRISPPTQSTALNSIAKHVSSEIVRI